MRRRAEDADVASGGPDTTTDGRFTATDWSLIAAAQGEDSARARQALGDLCATYWYPLYAYIRRRGQPADRARDLTQGLFASLLEHDFLDRAVPEKGRFRTFLLAACRNFLANQSAHDHAAKRGGTCVTLSLDFPDAEGRYAREPGHGLTPERLFERRWTLTLLDGVLARLKSEMVDAGKGLLFDRLSPALVADGSGAPHARVARELAMSEDAVKMAALRLRRRFRDLLVEEVARTVIAPGTVEDEIRDLFAAVRP